jgi:hypothetical protein
MVLLLLQRTSSTKRNRSPQRRRAAGADDLDSNYAHEFELRAKHRTAATTAAPSGRPGDPER